MEPSNDKEARREEGKERGGFMDAEFKLKLTKFAEATLRDLKVGGLKVTLEMMVRETHFRVASNARKSACKDLRRRLVNARLWTESEQAMCNDWMGQLLLSILRKQEVDASKVVLSAARARQLELFPGFHELPVRIRSGKGFLNFPEILVPQFLIYEAKYQARATRNQQTAEELHRLAQAVKPYTELEMNMATAFQRAQAQPAALMLVAQKRT